MSLDIEKLKLSENKTSLEETAEDTINETTNKKKKKKNKKKNKGKNLEEGDKKLGARIFNPDLNLKVPENDNVADGYMSHR